MHLSASRSFRWRWLAPLLAVVVLGLGALAVVPAAHEELHADAHDAAHSCAIVLFAEGVLVAAAAILSLAALQRLAAVQWRTVQRLRTVEDFLHPPLRGPPAA